MNLIFDFDGTLVDSFALALEKFNILAEQFNFKRIDQKELSHLRNLSSRELIQYLNIPLYKIPKLVFKARKLMHAEIHHLAPIANIPETLQQLVDANISLGILTSNSIDNVKVWLEQHHMQHLFKFIHITSSYYGKNRGLKKILKKYDIAKSDAYYIGDETRDIEAAKYNQIRSIAVTWGFNSEKILVSEQPDYLARTPADLLRILDIS